MAKLAAPSVNFYSRPCGRGDRRAAEDGVEGRVISTHAPAGGATLIIACAAGADLFLLTPLREGRPDALHADCVPLAISTHAPAGGATVTAK